MKVFLAFFLVPLATYATDVTVFEGDAVHWACHKSGSTNLVAKRDFSEGVTIPVKVVRVAAQEIKYEIYESDVFRASCDTLVVK